jgi:hypothetical protein
MNIIPFQAPETASAQVTLYAAAGKSVKKNTCVFSFKRIFFFV